MIIQSVYNEFHLDMPIGEMEKIKNSIKIFLNQVLYDFPKFSVEFVGTSGAGMQNKFSAVKMNLKVPKTPKGDHKSLISLVGESFLKLKEQQIGEVSLKVVGKNPKSLFMEVTTEQIGVNLLVKLCPTHVNRSHEEKLAALLYMYAHFENQTTRVKEAAFFLLFLLKIKKLAGYRD